MIPLRALIVDDEPLARERLRGMLETEPRIEVVGECADGNEALAAIRRLAPDAVFLDMQMPGCDGMQLIARLPATGRPAIVFTTAHDRFALEAFAVAAVDYLLKPFDCERLQQAVRRVCEHRGMNATMPPSPDAPEARRPERLAVKADGRIVFLRPEEIIRAEADDNHVTLHLTQGRLMIRETLAALAARLGPENFTRVNRSTLVHLDQIKELQPAMHGDFTVVLRDGTRLPLSRSFRGRLDGFAGGPV